MTLTKDEEKRLHQLVDAKDEAGLGLLQDLIQNVISSGYHFTNPDKQAWWNAFLDKYMGEAGETSGDEESPFGNDAGNTTSASGFDEEWQSNFSGSEETNTAESPPSGGTSQSNHNPSGQGSSENNNTHSGGYSPPPPEQGGNSQDSSQNAQNQQSQSSGEFTPQTSEGGAPSDPNDPVGKPPIVAPGFSEETLLKSEESAIVKAGLNTGTMFGAVIYGFARALQPKVLKNLLLFACLILGVIGLAFGVLYLGGPAFGSLRDGLTGLPQVLSQLGGSLIDLIIGIVGFVVGLILLGVIIAAIAANKNKR